MKYLYSLGLAILLLGFVFFRPLNYDESYYMVSAQQICDGKLPYIDFVFHQTPLLIFVYAVIPKLGYASLILGRILSVMLFAGSFLIFRGLLKGYTNKNAIALFSILFLLNTFMLNWAVSIKIYALSVFLLAAGFYFFKLFIDEPGKLNLIFCSLAFSFLFLTKIVFASCLGSFIIFTIIFIYRYDKKIIISYTVIMLISILIPIMLFFLLLGHDFNIIYFNLFQINFLFRNYFKDPLLYALFKNFIAFLLPQNLILILLILFSGFNYTFFEKFIITNIVLFFIVHFASFMLPEYMVSVMPLVVLLAFLKFEKFKERFINKYRQINPKRLLTYILALYIIAAPFNLEHLKYLIEHRTLVFNPFEMMQLENQIDKLQGRKILSSWDAYSIFSNKSTSIKNDYTSIQIIDYVDETTIKKYNLREPKEYEIMIKSREPDVIVYDRNNPLYLTGLETLIAQNYNKVFEYKYIVVYRKM